MNYSTDNNVPQESELPKWSSRACEIGDVLRFLEVAVIIASVGWLYDLLGASDRILGYSDEDIVKK